MTGSFWDGVNPQTVEQAASGFFPFAIGDNQAFIGKVTPKESKNSGKKMLDILFKKDDGAEIHYYIVDDEYKLSKLKQIQLCFDIPFGNTRIETWCGKRGIVHCKEDHYNGNTYPKVAYLKPILKSDKANQKQPDCMDSVGDAAQGSSDTFIDDIPF